MQITNWKNAAKILFFALLIYLPLFLHLDKMVIGIWDESRVVHTTMEMADNHQWFVPYFGGKPDTWSTKPPLLIWLQVFFVSLLGAKELAFRLPSAIAAALTCMTLMGYCLRYLKSYLLGLLTCAVLVTSTGYIALHVTRTCEYDSLLIGEMVVYALAFFRYTQTEKNKWLYLFFIALTFAGLTKGIAALIAMPGIALYALLSQKILSLLKNKHSYVGMAIFVCFVGAYYLVRESLTPGYLAIMWENDAAGRFKAVSEVYETSAYWYLELIEREGFHYWLLGVPIGLYVGYAHKDKHIQQLTLFSFCFCACYLLIISLSKTKLPWYHAPLYPFMALWVALAIRHFFQFIKDSVNFNKGLRYPYFAHVLLLLLFISPYFAIMSQVYFPKYPTAAVEEYGFEISDWLRKNPKTDLTKYVLLYRGYAPHLSFYTTYIKPIATKSLEELTVGDVVVVVQNDLKEALKTRFVLRKIKAEEFMEIWEIVEKKEG